MEYRIPSLLLVSSGTAKIRSFKFSTNLKEAEKTEIRKGDG